MVVFLEDIRPANHLVDTVNRLEVTVNRLEVTVNHLEGTKEVENHPVAIVTKNHLRSQENEKEKKTKTKTWRSSCFQSIPMAQFYPIFTFLVGSSFYDPYLIELFLKYR